MRALGAQLRLPEADEVERGNNEGALRLNVAPRRVAAIGLAVLLSVPDIFIDGMKSPTSEKLEKMIMRLEQLSANATPS
jgi:hypothetical protein